MIGILLLAHAPLASAFLSVAQHIFQQDLSQIEAIDVLPDQPPAEVIARAQAMINRLDTGMGVLVLTDTFGSTPANCAEQLASIDQVAVLTGLNTPMLLKALTARTNELSVVCDMSRIAAQSGMLDITACPKHVE